MSHIKIPKPYFRITQMSLANTVVLLLF